MWKNDNENDREVVGCKDCIQCKKKEDAIVPNLIKRFVGRNENLHVKHRYNTVWLMPMCTSNVYQVKS
jgi:hypothetical protein